MMTSRPNAASGAKSRIRRGPPSGELDQRHPALHLAAQDDIAFRIDTVNLKHGLRDIETNRRDRLHRWLLRIGGTLPTPPSSPLRGGGRSRAQHQREQ